MVSEERVKAGFQRVKEDMEGMKNELAFALRRVAKIEEILTKMAIQKAIARSSKKKKL